MQEINIEYLNIDEIKPYANNPRHNDEAVEAVANSIREFGFKVPIVIDQNNIIVTGHTRLKASKRLGLTKVPCIKATDLTDEQIKAFRLADNKVGEIAEWDVGKLSLELADIANIDMSNFGFELDEIEVDDKYSDTSDDEEPCEVVEKLESHYGVPYQGNKSRIADIIVNLLPEGKRLVDLFGGGGCDYTLCNVIKQVERVSLQRHKSVSNDVVYGRGTRKISR